MTQFTPIEHQNTPHLLILLYLGAILSCR